MNSTAPGSTFIIRSILFTYTKIPKILGTLFYLLFIYQSIIYRLISFLDRREIDNLSFALGAKVCVVCAGAGVAWFSYWIDNLGFLTEGNTYSTVLHHHLLSGDKNPTQSTSRSETEVKQ